MKKLNHENIVKLYDYFEEENYAYFILECCNGGSLSRHLKDYKRKHNAPFPQYLIQLFFRQIVKGLNHIHNNGIIHRDIKLDNILLNFKNNKFHLANQGNIICIHFDELPRTTELNENIKQYMHELLDDYQKAEKYFRNNKLISQEEDAKNKIILIKTKYNQIKLGQKN